MSKWKIHNCRFSSPTKFSISFIVQILSYSIFLSCFVMRWNIFWIGFNFGERGGTLNNLQPTESIDSHAIVLFWEGSQFSGNSFSFELAEHIRQLLINEQFTCFRINRSKILMAFYHIFIVCNSYHELDRSCTNTFFSFSCAIPFQTFAFLFPC